MATRKKPPTPAPEPEPAPAPAARKRTPRKAITHQGVLALRPREQRYVEQFEQQGLGVRVTPNGQKTFLYLYYVAKEGGGYTKRWMTLGTFPTMSVEAAIEAHRKAATAKGEEGKDPALEAKQKKEATRKAVEIAARADAKPTLKFVVDELRKNPDFLARAVTSKEVLRQLDKDVVPVLGHRVFAELTKRDAVLVVDAVRKRGPRIGNDCAANFVRLGKFAEKRGLLEDGKNPFRDFERTRTPSKDRALGIRDDDQDDDRTWELQRVLERMPAVGFDYMTVLVLMFVLATGQRPGEVCGMPKAELKQEGTLWTIAADRYKTAWREAHPKPHHVPLSGYAQQLLKIAERYNAGSPWVFPSWRDKAVPIDSNSVPRAVRRKLGTPTPHDVEPAPGTFGVEPFTPHDLRRTCRSWMAVLGVPDAVAEKVLGHKLSGMMGIYNRHTYLEERRAALELWAAKLQELAPGLLDVLGAMPVRKAERLRAAKTRKLRRTARASTAR